MKGVYCHEQGHTSTPLTITVEARPPPTEPPALPSSPPPDIEGSVGTLYRRIDTVALLASSWPGGLDGLERAYYQWLRSGGSKVPHIH